MGLFKAMVGACFLAVAFLWGNVVLHILLASATDVGTRTVVILGIMWLLFWLALELGRRVANALGTILDEKIPD